MLAAKADGTKLPPYIIFKGKRASNLPKISGCLVVCSPNGWMTRELCVDWIKKTFTSLTPNKSLLVWDT